MKIKVSIYNDDEGARDIQVVELNVGREPKVTVLQPEGKGKNSETFRIIRGDMLIVTATGD